MSATESRYRFDVLGAKTLPDMVRMTLAYFQELAVMPEFLSWDQDLTVPLKYYASPRGGFWLGRKTDGDKVLGVAGIMPIARRVCELKRWFVSADARNQGLGSALLVQAMDFASHHDYIEVLLALRQDQKVAFQLAQRFGFKPCARFNDNRQAGIFLSFKLSAEI